MRIIRLRKFIIIAFIVIVTGIIVTYVLSQWLCKPGAEGLRGYLGYLLYVQIYSMEPTPPSDYSGEWRTWWLSGGEKDKYDVVNGKWHGKYALYDEDGKVVVQGFYRYGEESGHWIRYDHGGCKRREWYCKDGQEHGQVIEWDINGNIVGGGWKLNGKLVTKEQFDSVEV